MGMWGRPDRSRTLTRVNAWVSGQHWAAWVVSGIGLALAGLSLWYLIIVEALFLGAVAEVGPMALVLKVIEVALLAGFSLVLVYAGYWMVSSPFDRADLWWAGLWTLIGLGGVVAIVSLVTAFQVAQGRAVSDPSLIQEMLLAAGGGALAGLLIGISTVRETIEGEKAKRQRETLLFVNELLRHNVLNGLQVILGNTDLLREHVDEEGEELLAVTEDRGREIADLIDDVQVLMRSISGDTACRPVLLSAVLEEQIHALEATHPGVTVEADVPAGLEVWGGDMLGAVFANLLDNAVTHTAEDDARVTVTVEERPSDVVIAVADDGPGIPDPQKDRVFEPGEQGEHTVGGGLGLYLVDQLLERYGGDVRIGDNDPRGTVAVVELPKPGSAAAEG